MGICASLTITGFCIAVAPLPKSWKWTRLHCKFTSMLNKREAVWFGMQGEQREKYPVEELLSSWTRFRRRICSKHWSLSCTLSPDLSFVLSLPYRVCCVQCWNVTEGKGWLCHDQADNSCLNLWASVEVNTLWALLQWRLCSPLQLFQDGIYLWSCGALPQRYSWYILPWKLHSEERTKARHWRNEGRRKAEINLRVLVNLLENSQGKEICAARVYKSCTERTWLSASMKHSPFWIQEAWFGLCTWNICLFFS